MEITFKNATRNDIDTIFALNKKLIDDYETNLNLDFRKVFSWVQRKIRNNIESYQCIYLDQIHVGYYYLHNEDGKLELDDFFIFEQFQGSSIGTRILQYVASIADKENKDIFLYVFVENQKAINLYLKNGYTIIQEVDGSRYIMTRRPIT